MIILNCVKEVKKRLYKNTELTISLLEMMGCHDIGKRYDGEIRCALPEATNSTSVQVMTSNDLIPAYIHSRPEYESYEIKDIISLCMFILNLRFDESLSWICAKLDIEYNQSNRVITRQSETIAILNKYKRKNKSEDIKREIITEEKLNQYPLHIVDEWTREGVSREAQIEYGIRIDEKRCRYLIPILDDDNRVVSLKGRSYLPNYKELGLQKYIYYKKIKRNDILFGINQNTEAVKEKNEIILFEGEKSVMKTAFTKYSNSCSVGKNGINKYLLMKILSLHCDVVLAFDKDVKESVVRAEARKLSPFTNVSYIIDEKGFLDKKDSPVDKGMEIFDELYNSKIKM